MAITPFRRVVRAFLRLAGKFVAKEVKSKLKNITVCHINVISVFKNTMVIFVFIGDPSNSGERREFCVNG